MTLSRKLVLVSVMVAAAFASRPAAAVGFTGDVPVDFSVPDAEVFADPIGDSIAGIIIGSLNYVCHF